VLITLARKPLDGTVAQAALVLGTAGMNIAGSRIGTECIRIANYNSSAGGIGNLIGVSLAGTGYTTRSSAGRWPANVLLSSDSVQALDERTSDLSGRGNVSLHGSMNGSVKEGFLKGYKQQTSLHTTYGDTGTASRFFKRIG
jgi:hypothetical protein